jgi:hypothetical protein
MAFTEIYSAGSAESYVVPRTSNVLSRRARDSAGRIPAGLLQKKSDGKVSSQDPAHWSLASVRRVPTDVRLPCMVYAATVSLPESARASVDIAIAETRKLPGVLHVIAYADHLSLDSGGARLGMAVIARGYWLARQSLARLVARCGGGDAETAMEAVAHNAAFESQVERGTAQYIEGRLRLWLATADLAGSRSLAARIAAIHEDRVDIRSIGFTGSEPGPDVLVPAIALARELRRTPVQVIVARRPPLRLVSPGPEIRAEDGRGSASDADADAAETAVAA